jgi:LemA protein
VQSDERIGRMEADGILTPSQAAMLRDSIGALAGRAVERVAPARAGIPWWVMAAGAAIVVAGVFVVAVLPGGTQAPVQDVTQTLNQPGGYGEMNKSLSVVLGLVTLLVPPLLLWGWLHNSLVAREEKVFESWAQTESNLQRRADLIPGLVDTVSRYLRHESETFTSVARERSAAAKVPEEVEKLVRAEKQSTDILRQAGKQIVEDEARMQRLVEAQAALRQSMTSLFAVAEAYPQLRSADQFLELQAQLEGTENRINVARMRFNDAVRDYNAKIRMLPWSLAATLGDFRRKAYFRSEEEARHAPDLAFD